MVGRNDFKFNLGLPTLLGEWRKIFSRDYFIADATAGMTVACVAIPLSLAIALASGVPPATGLITAIIAGLVCAFFGGTPLAVSGPAAAMSILIADIVEKFGIPSLILIGCIAGCMQLLSGIVGIGKLGRFVPLPVISGFTAGIGVIIIIGQLPRAFGIAPPPETHIFSVLTHLNNYLHTIDGTSLFLVAITIGIIQGIPKITNKIPAILCAVVISTLVTYFFQLNTVELIGAIPNRLPAPVFPSLTDISLSELIFNALVIYLLASLETLLSSSSADKISGGKKHDPDQELIGQGLGNIVVSLFGGIPITGVIARTAINIRAGARTRRASIIHSFIILAAVLFISPIISAIPIAALAGVLFCVAFSMINYREFRNLWKTARSDAIIYAVTFFTIVFVDLLAGIQAGIVAACLIVLWRSSKTHLHISTTSQDDVLRISLFGALTFLSTGKIAGLQKQLATKQKKTIIMDLASIRNLDISGTTCIVDLYNYCKSNNIQFYIKGLPKRFELLFKLCEGEELLSEYYVVYEHELRKKGTQSVPVSTYGRLVHGINRFYLERKHNDKRLFEFITQSQDPHTLFITCSDSRIIPSMITSADPGELFIVRNIGNFIPPYQEESPFSEGAALQFALSTFDITDIVICGHANCGAINACDKIDASAPSILFSWINRIKNQLGHHSHASLNEKVRINVLNQIENLKTYPIIQQKLQDKCLNIHGWFFDFDESLVYEWRQHENEFKSIVLQEEPQAV